MKTIKFNVYPGDKDAKLIDSQIGNMLASKFGDKSEVLRLIDTGDLVLLPLADARGVDISGPIGVYWTEAQNSSIDMMKLALQRCGEETKIIIDGDNLAQVDLHEYENYHNGMSRLSEIFKGQEYYGEVNLKNIYRSKIAKQAELM